MTSEISTELEKVEAMLERRDTQDLFDIRETIIVLRRLLPGPNYIGLDQMKTFAAVLQELAKTQAICDAPWDVMSVMLATVKCNAAGDYKTVILSSNVAKRQLCIALGLAQDSSLQNALAIAKILRDLNKASNTSWDLDEALQIVEMLLALPRKQCPAIWDALSFCIENLIENIG